jgi:hypothetical protein
MAHKKLTLESLLLYLVLQEGLIDKNQQAEIRLKSSRFIGAHPLPKLELVLTAQNNTSLKLTNILQSGMPKS